VGDEVARDLFPVGVEVLRRRVEEGEAGAVGGLLDAVEDRRVQRAAELVGVEVVQAAVADDRRGATSTLSETPLRFPRSRRL
jgi:hypothetical protein